MKQKLSWCAKLCKLRFLTIFLFIAIVILAMDYTKFSDDHKKAKAFVDNYYKTHKLPISDSKNQDYFDKLILESKLSINNKNYSYELLEEQEGVIIGNYTLSLKGTYLDFLKYLNALNSRIMLYKIDSINLKISSPTAIKIKMEMKTLYEVD